MSRLDEIKAKLSAQADARESAKADQEATDLEALFEARAEHGVEAVQAVKIPFEPGLPLLAVVRRPSPVEFKRFQSRCTKKDAGSPEYLSAAEELAEVCRVYPAADVFAKMLAVCPGLKVGLGTAAAALAQAKSVEDLKG
jgi:hypothetical protein